jgi:hypothetical protein
MIYYLTYSKDSIGNNYPAIDIPSGVVDPFLNDLKEIIGDDDFEVYTKNQENRDHGRHHITVINVMEYNALAKSMGMDKLVNSLEQAFKYEIDDLKMLGVGTATRNNNRAYFIVCQSDKLDAIRNRYNLGKQDFHITLGFKFKDVFGVPKNVVIDKKTKFIKLLKIEYYKNDNWNFLKKIENFDLNPQSEIIPVSLSDDKMKIKCDGYYMDISLMDDEKFRIVTKYAIDKDEEIPRLPETEISKILKNKA